MATGAETAGDCEDHGAQADFAMLGISFWRTARGYVSAAAERSGGSDKGGVTEPSPDDSRKGSGALLLCFNASLFKHRLLLPDSINSKRHFSKFLMKRNISHNGLSYIRICIL
ncbi:hypothetical protein [Paracoccus aerius]|uniref:hypothetical protein n=1 Tax=Paracoccus aerius TaxID=1915382 RepID=UPI001928AD07|nr:hypothetical protein [Paracoccus aerius]